MDAVTSGSADGLTRGELNEEMSRIERELRRRLPVGWSTSYQSLVREFVTQQGYSSHALERTLYVLEKKEVIRFSGQVSCAFSRVLLMIVLLTRGIFRQKKVVHRYDSFDFFLAMTRLTWVKGWSVSNNRCQIYCIKFVRIPTYLSINCIISTITSVRVLLFSLLFVIAARLAQLDRASDF